MKNKRENGEVVVEASIIVTLVVIVISIMFYIGMVLYQQTAIAVVANRTATNISQVYSNTLRDPFTGYVDPDNAYQSVTYSNMKTDAYLDAIQQKATVFAQYRLKKSQIIPAVNREVDVQVVNKPNEILKGQVVVTITDTYDVPLVGMFGLDGGLSFSATGRADCVDYLEYLLGVEAIADPENSPIQSLPDSDTCIVTFVKDKYSGGFHAAVPVLRGKSIVTSNNHSHSTMPENPELNGMKFTGWVTDAGRNFSASTQVDDNITVYGTWDCKITFDPTGGTVDPATKMVGYKKTTTLPNPSKYGFEFLGWYSDVEYSEEYKSNNGTGTQYISGVTEIPGNITLYAKWKCIHAEFTHKKLDAGNCKTKSTWLRECKTCDYSDQYRGAYGSCQKGSNKTQISPSCTTTGWYVANCKFCDRLMESGVIDALGHKYASNKKDYDIQDHYRAATCYRTGIKGSKCSRCGAEQGEILPMTKHNLDSGTVTKNATCYSVGTKRFKCKTAGCTYYEDKEIAKTSHNLDSGIVIKAATCTEAGQKRHYCQNSGCSYYENRTVGKTGHKMDSGKVTKAATCTTSGVTTYSCTNAGCSHQTKETTPELGHKMQSYNKPATCQEKGWSGKKCVRDGCDHKEGEELDKKEHSYKARCGTTHYYYNTGFKIKCYGSGGGYTSHEWDEGFQCVTCEYCGQFEPMSYSDSDEKLYEGYCRRRYIKVNGDNKFLYSSETVWCVEHKDFDDVKVVVDNHNIYDCTKSNYKKDSNYNKKIEP